MLAAQSGHHNKLIQSPKTTGHHNKLIQSTKTSRRPLQPKNQSSITATNLKPNPAEWARLDNSNKENFCHPPLKKDSFPMESLDVSLADELSAIREKLERLRIDREKNNKLLEERGFVMDLKLKEVVNRGEIQKQLEIEVDRLYRLKEIRLACTRISQIRSLRDKEQEKKMKRDMLNKEYTKDEGKDGQKDERLSHDRGVVQGAHRTKTLELFVRPSPVRSRPYAILSPISCLAPSPVMTCLRFQHQEAPDRGPFSLFFP